MFLSSFRFFECLTNKPKMRRRWLVVILLLVSPFFFIGGADYYDPRSVKEIWNLGHLVFFAMLVLVLDDYWCSLHRSIVFRIFATLLILLFVGVGIELIQRNIATRSCSLIDVARDLSGGAIVLFWRASRRLRRLQAMLCGFLLFLVVTYNIIPLLIDITDEYRSYRDFPLLAGFESDAEFDRWAGGRRAGFQRVSTPRLQGEYSAKIILTTDTYSGVSLDHFPGDWSGRGGLAFNVFNPDRPLVLHYRVHDDRHHRGTKELYTDRFNGRTVVEHGWNEIVIPMADILNAPEGRAMDLTKISAFGLFVMNQAEPKILFLDNVRLL